MARNERSRKLLFSTLDPDVSDWLDRVQGDSAMRLCACALAESAAKDCDVLNGTARSLLEAARAHAMQLTTDEDLRRAREATNVDERARDADNSELESLREYEAGNISHEQYLASFDRARALFAIVYCADPNSEEGFLNAVNESYGIRGGRTEEEWKVHYIQIISQFAS